MFPQHSFDPKIPAYHLLVDHFLEDSYYVAGTQISYEGEPSEHMAPLNDAAVKRISEMNRYLDECAAEKAALMGRPVKQGDRTNDVGERIVQDFTDARNAVKRAIPQVPDKPAPLHSGTMSISDRRQQLADKTKVRAQQVAPQPTQGRPQMRPIHNPTSEGQVAPIQGE